MPNVPRMPAITLPKVDPVSVLNTLPPFLATMALSGQNAMMVR